jgi:NADH-quinone oxidoreductase subunit L
MFRPVYLLAAHKYYIDELYEAVIINPVLALTRWAFRFDQRVIDGAVNRTGSAGLSLSALKGWIDQHILDGLVNGMAFTIGRTGAVIRLIQTGLVQNYLLIAAGGAVILFLFLRRIP